MHLVLLSWTFIAVTAVSPFFPCKLLFSFFFFTDLVVARLPPGPASPLLLHSSKFKEQEKKGKEKNETKASANANYDALMSVLQKWRVL